MDLNNTRYKVKGELWFGSNYFHEEITALGNKESRAKEEFLQKLKAKSKKPKDVEFENFYLLLNKYVPVIRARILEKLDNGGERERPWFDLDGESIGGDSKKYFLEAIIESFKFKYFRNYTDEVRKMLKSQYYKEVIYRSFTTKSRLVIGLGSSHILETALTLHHIYGVPYIPGSALKGVCRAVAFWKLAEKKGILNNEDKIKELSKQFHGKLVEDDNDILTYQLLFGAQDFKGLLLFLDAYPIIEENAGIFEIDIMNNHYPSYYGEGKPPGDWENPVPIYFLTVKPGVKFKICVLFDEFRWKKLKESGIKNDEVERFMSNNNFLEEILKIALNQFGVGAKGRLGYGILE